MSFTIKNEDNYDLNYDWTPKVIYIARLSIDLSMIEHYIGNPQPLIMTEAQDDNVTFAVSLYSMLISSPESKQERAAASSATNSIAFPVHS